MSESLADVVHEAVERAKADEACDPEWVQPTGKDYSDPTVIENARRLNRAACAVMDVADAATVPVLERIENLSSIRGDIDYRLRRLIATAVLDEGASWAQIAEQLGVSKQTAYNRHRRDVQTETWLREYRATKAAEAGSELP